MARIYGEQKKKKDTGHRSDCGDMIPSPFICSVGIAILEGWNIFGEIYGSRYATISDTREVNNEAMTDWRFKVSVRHVNQRTLSAG